MILKKSKRHLLRTLCVFALLPSLVHAEFKSTTDNASAKKLDIEVIPYIFSTESLGVAGGLVGLWKGAGQPQAAVFGTVLGSNKGSWMGFVSANNYALSPQSRFLFGAQAYEADFKQFDYHLGLDASNHSNPNQMIRANSREALHHLSMRYFFPMGSAVHQPIYATLTPHRQVKGYTPWQSGITSFELRPFYQSRTLEQTTNQTHSSDFSDATEVWAIASQLRWDNRNQSDNPNYGNFSEITITANIATDDAPSWWKWEASHSWYLNLGAIQNYIEQQSLAFNIYTADTPTWNQTQTIQGQTMYRRPPEFAAPSLGGLYRLRGYPTGRFVDRSALSYSMEYRVNPTWQPLGDVPVFNWYQIGWWQWVAFAEMGRVANAYDLVQLHQDMKWTLGGGVRFQIEGVVVRTEMASSSEGASMRIMVNQPF